MKKATIIDTNMMFAEMFATWNKKNKNTVVTNDAILPGILLIFPIPNKVTNKKLIFLSISNNGSYYFASYSFFLSNNS